MVLFDRSVQASITAGGARVISVRVRRNVVLEGELGAEAIDALELEQRAAKRRTDEASRASARLRSSEEENLALAREASTRARFRSKAAKR